MGSISWVTFGRGLPPPSTLSFGTRSMKLGLVDTRNRSSFAIEGFASTRRTPDQLKFLTRS